MEESKGNEFIQMIRALWNEQKKREILYLEALKKDGMGPFRRVLSQGHVSAVLFQKEIRSVYDYFKCFLTDKELTDHNQLAARTSLEMLENVNGKEEVASCLKKIEAAVIQMYESVRNYLEKEPEAQRLMDEHLVRTSEFYDMLCKYESGGRRNYGLTAAA
ncbi:hypothetical protein GCM10010967_41680 [Dyadobacter beijingensis]|uniref:Ferritin-like metal-binding protein YciE n=1 Tax=Dyadobacter beijingensis TaxID=365489 RepID=A0ABQ2I9M8_9BACT|nr:hypothetical protein [Dyadobacter beijingensis]GGN02658.1 hypothetical protein GCM10010967_41680 [Dyadobacter beijingensis]